MIKKIVKGTFTVCLMLFLVIPYQVVEASSAETIDDLYKELAAFKNERDKNISERRAKERERNRLLAEVNNIIYEIKTAQEEIVELESEVEELEKKIIEKEEETKKLVNSLQITQGEAELFEYIFGAKDYTEFIYRFAIVEQLAKYNTQLLNEMADMIERNKNSRTNLIEKNKLLEKRRAEYIAKTNQYDRELIALSDVSISIEDEIRALEQLIRFYESAGCGRYQKLTSCIKVPADTTFTRPMGSAVVTAGYGWQKDPLNPSRQRFHGAIDMALAKPNVDIPIYAVANGKVSSVISKSSCGGNQVYINHIVKGKYYTSGYVHLARYTVKVGDIVHRGQIIGYMGGSRKSSNKTQYTPWDRCSTGAHLHFSMATGHYMGIGPNSYTLYSDYSGYYYYQNGVRKYNPRYNINPRNLISLPYSW